MLLKLCTSIINPRGYSKCLRIISMSRLNKNASLFYCTFHFMYSPNSSSLHMQTVPSKNSDLLPDDLSHVNQAFIAFQVCICCPTLSNAFMQSMKHRYLHLAHHDSIQIIKIRIFLVLVSHCFFLYFRINSVTCSIY